MTETNSVEYLKEQNENLAKEFSVKRAQFIELFKQKEEECKKLEHELSELQNEKETLVTNSVQLKAELDGIKTATAISEASREDEFLALKRQHDEESASIQQLIKEAVTQVRLETSDKYEQEILNLKNCIDRLNGELQEGKSKLSHEREGFLDSIAKTLQKKVTNPLGSNSSDDENLEESMKKAQEHTELLKSVVLPLEEEITSLKEQLHIANQRLREVTINQKQESSVEEENCMKFAEGERFVPRSRSSQSLLLNNATNMEIDAGELLETKSLNEGSETPVVDDLAEQCTKFESEKGSFPKELHISSDKLCKSCEVCKSYEEQLKQVISKEKEAEAKARTFERQLEMERSTLKSLQKYSSDVELALKQTCLDAQSQISNLYAENDQLAGDMQDIRQQYTDAYKHIQDELIKLTKGRDQVHDELRKLEDENNTLIGKHSKHSQLLQEETINLPDSLEDMQLLLLNYREELIASKIAKEHIEESLRSEILFYKSQVVAEQQEKNKIEDALSAEINQLQENITILQSVKSELDRQSKLRSEAEKQAKDVELTLKNSQAKSKQLITALQSQVEDHSKARTSLEQQVYEQRVKIQGLQNDLDNSEAVQRDFVKLSQSLQIQLEKIRAGEHEVRWQHEEDAQECMNCKKTFESSKAKKKNAKVNCLHCGKIFCPDCISKTVLSGPNKRASRVCDVCHTILDRDATPYFSSEAPPN